MRSTTASGRWRPGLPRSWRFATPVSHQVDIWWRWTILLAMMQTEFWRLREFVSSLRSGQLEWRQTASDSKVRSQER